MYKGWIVALASSAILFFIISFVLSATNYKRRFKDKYDIRNHFPYEFNYEGSFADNLLGNIALVTGSMFSISVFVIAGVSNYTNGLLIAVLGAGTLLSIIAGAIHFFPLKYIKAHLLVMVLLFVSAFATPALIAFAFFRHYQDFKDMLSLVFFIVSAIIALFLFVLIMNPKLSFNITMTKATDEKGNEYYVRPNFIVVAFSEWMMVYSLLISHLLLLIFLTLIG